MSILDVRGTRKHTVLARRERQLRLNTMVREGGAEYISVRLARFPYESDSSWNGAQSSDSRASWKSDSLGVATGNSQGRKDRAFLINYASRIVVKTNNYVFAQGIGRDGIDETFELDVSKTGLTVNAFMEEVSAAYTAAQWCWIGVDRGGASSQRSVAQREAEGDRVWWSLWLPHEVVDWHFDDSGQLTWLITEEEIYENSDVMVEPTTQWVRTLWKPGGGVRLYMNEADHTKIDREEPFTTSADIVPFVLVGIPSQRPWWFDDVERVQAALLNLESAQQENLVQSVYPQLVLPHGIIDEIMRLCELKGVKGYQAALEMVRGLNYPILEPTEARGLSRYLTPDAQDLKAIPDGITRLRQELLDIVGLSMRNPDTKQVQSAAEKAWDNLDPSITLRKRAVLMEEAEKKAVEISCELDSSFKEYTPEYPRQFDIPDPKQDFQTLLELDNLTLPESARKEIARACVKFMSRIVSIPKERYEEIMRDIDEGGELGQALSAVAGNATQRVDRVAIGENTPARPGEKRS